MAPTELRHRGFAGQSLHRCRGTTCRSSHFRRAAPSRSESLPLGIDLDLDLRAIKGFASVYSMELRHECALRVLEAPPIPVPRTGIFDPPCRAAPRISERHYTVRLRRGLARGAAGLADTSLDRLIMIFRLPVVALDDIRTGIAGERPSRRYARASTQSSLARTCFKPNETARSTSSARFRETGDCLPDICPARRRNHKKSHHGQA